MTATERGDARRPRPTRTGSPRSASWPGPATPSCSRTTTSCPRSRTWPTTPGDSLALSRIAADSPASTIVFCGVHFMAETAKILAPDKTVLIPDARAGCSLADSITADELRAWKAEHPGAVVVSYVNTTAAVKAETDVCCTSSNAVEVVASIPADREVLFLPDQFLGAHVRRTLAAGEHARLGGGVPRPRRHQRRRADRAGHRAPRRRAVRAPRVRLRDVGALPRRQRRGPRGPGQDPLHRRDARRRPRLHARSQVLVATEVGMLHQLRRAAPEIDFRAVNDRASCRYMKMITPEALLRSLRDGHATRCTSTPSWPPAGGPPCSA